MPYIKTWWNVFLMNPAEVGSVTSSPAYSTPKAVYHWGRIASCEPCGSTAMGRWGSYDIYLPKGGTLWEVEYYCDSSDPCPTNTAGAYRVYFEGVEP